MTAQVKRPLLDFLERTQLLSSEQIDQIITELLPDFPDDFGLARYLVEIDWLTAYQLSLMMAGRWDEIVTGPYQILDRIGEGGISEVYKAWDTVHGRIVALKVLRSDLTDYQDIVHQFQLEYHTTARLNHANIMKAYDSGRINHLHYFAMEFIEGMDLERFIKQVGPLPVDLACDLGRQAAQGLQHAHQVGLVHRDVKPANLFLLNPPIAGAKKGQDPVVKVIDWGLARSLNKDGDGPAPADDAEKGRLIGTADYIAPEQIEDATLVDIRADIYSMGGVMYFLLTGSPPFKGSSVMQKIVQHKQSPPPSVREIRPDVSPELDEFIQRMLAKTQEERPQIPLLVVGALRKFATGHHGIPLSLRTPGAAPGTVLNLPRPQTHASLLRPSSQAMLPRPGTQSNLTRPTATK